MKVKKVSGNNRRESNEEEENCWRESRGNQRKEMRGNRGIRGNRGCKCRLIERK